MIFLTTTFMDMNFTHTRVHLFPYLLEQCLSRCGPRTSATSLPVQLKAKGSKKVLLCERKRHTARHVASARYAGGGGYPVPGPRWGTPSQVWGGPHPRSRGGTLSQVWGDYPITGPGGTPSQVRGGTPS